MSYKYIFWDWNGTLFDDAYPTYEAVNDMLTRRNIEKIDFQRYRDTVEVPIINFYNSVMDMSKESMEEISKEFDNDWSAHLVSCPIFDSARELLTMISERGIKQYIYSSSRSEKIIPYLDAFKLTSFFEAVIGASDCYVGSKAERTRDYIRDNCIDPKETLFIGDMDHDSEVASFVGSDCILVECGHQSIKKLAPTGRKVIPTINELKPIILNFEVVK